MLNDDFVLFTAVTTGTSVAYPFRGGDRFSTAVEWAALTTTGTIVYEWARSADYAGTWKTLATYAVAAGTPAFVDGETGDFAGNVWIRARFTTNADVAPTVYLGRATIGLY